MRCSCMFGIWIPPPPSTASLVSAPTCSAWISLLYIGSDAGTSLDTPRALRRQSVGGSADHIGTTPCGKFGAALRGADAVGSGLSGKARLSSGSKYETPNRVHTDAPYPEIGHRAAKPCATLAADDVRRRRASEAAWLTVRHRQAERQNGIGDFHRNGLSRNSCGHSSPCRA